MLYPKVFEGYFVARQNYGPVSTLPTPIYFYGMTVGQEISVEIKQGKTLVIRLLAIGDIDDDGNARLFFELNGQPRTVSMPHRKSSAGKAARRIADPGDPHHVAAPMPGSNCHDCGEGGPTGRGRRTFDDA